MTHHDPPEPRTLTLAQALAGVRPRPVTRAEWDAMHAAAQADSNRRLLARVLEMPLERPSIGVGPVTLPWRLVDL